MRKRVLRSGHEEHEGNEDTKGRKGKMMLITKKITHSKAFPGENRRGGTGGGAGRRFLEPPVSRFIALEEPSDFSAVARADRERHDATDGEVLAAPRDGDDRA
jgi:hypothetical protein